MDELKTVIRKKCRDNGFRYSIRGKNLTLTINEEKVKTKVVNSGYYDKIYTVHVPSLPGIPIQALEIFVDFWKYHAEAQKCDYLSFSTDIKGFEALDFIRFNNKYIVSLGSESANTVIEKCRLVHAAFSPITKTDPLFSYNLLHQANEMHVSFHKTGVSGQVRIKKVPFPGKGYNIEIPRTEQKDKINSLSDLPALIDKWMNEIYRKNRLNTVFESPKHHFNQAMNRLGIYYHICRNTIYDEMSKHYDGEEIEQIMKEASSSTIPTVSAKARSYTISLFDFNKFWAVSGKNTETFETKEDAIHAFEKTIVDLSFTRDNETKYKELKRA